MLLEIIAAILVVSVASATTAIIISYLFCCLIKIGEKYDKWQNTYTWPIMKPQKCIKVIVKTTKTSTHRK